EEVADFEEFTHLYLDSWTDPTMRWLLSTVSNSMIFDDHDLHDDWNTSEEWVEEMRGKPWWHDRVVGGFMSYWIYQHLGNMSPRDLDEDELWLKVRDCHTEDAGPALREFAFKADREAEGTRWSYCRDIAKTRLIVLDSRAGRVLKDGQRKMIDDAEWEWIVEHATQRRFNHLILATTLPVLLPAGMHHLEAWNEATAQGAWGKRFARVAEWIRQELDLEHWSAFHESFRKVMELVRDIGSGRRGEPPGSIVFLSGDVHNAYLAEAAFPREDGVKVPVWQAVCSPIRNPLATHERMIIKTSASKPFAFVTRRLARWAGVKPAPVRWRFVNKPTFDNQISTLDWEGTSAHLCLEKAVPGDPQHPRLERSFDKRLA
ncbi:MAG: hypothetical protein QOE77_4090, partial [Blastocatellia bacterium]|nr:hypothetical protein [Blastocatellia bacterium]